MIYDVTIDGKNHRLELNRADGRWTCRLEGREVEVDAVLARPDVLSLRIGNNAYEIKCERVGSDLHLWVGSVRFAAEVRDPRSLRGRSSRRRRSWAEEVDCSDARQSSPRSGSRR